MARNKFKERKKNKEQAMNDKVSEKIDNINTKTVVNEQANKEVEDKASCFPDKNKTQTKDKKKAGPGRKAGEFGPRDHKIMLCLNSVEIEKLEELMALNNKKLKSSFVRDEILVPFLMKNAK